jgi:hypothetical protein
MRQTHAALQYAVYRIARASGKFKQNKKIGRNVQRTRHGPDSGRVK